MTRTDWRPTRADRARLAGRSPQESPNYRLAAEVRALNSRLAQLPPESQRELQDDWLASWAELSGNWTALATTSSSASPSLTIGRSIGSNGSDDGQQVPTADVMRDTGMREPDRPAIV